MHNANYMKYLKIKLDDVSEKQINLITDYFQAGKIVVYPTDTVYGLGCLAIDKEAIDKIFEIKNREKSKSLLILAGSLAILKKYCCLDREQEKYLKKIRAGKRPISVILKKKKNLPQELTGGGETVAIRWPDLPKGNFLIKILNRVNQPIVSTSLNISGEKILGRVDGLDHYFQKAKPDLVVDAGVVKNKPSRLIDIKDLDNIKILRK